jgi:hypothetical protein
MKTVLFLTIPSFATETNFIHASQSLQSAGMKMDAKMGRCFCLSRKVPKKSPGAIIPFIRLTRLS